jgi:hypothetical protein
MPSQVTFPEWPVHHAVYYYYSPTLSLMRWTRGYIWWITITTAIRFFSPTLIKNARRSSSVRANEPNTLNYHQALTFKHPKITKVTINVDVQWQTTTYSLYIYYRSYMSINNRYWTIWQRDRYYRAKMHTWRIHTWVTVRIYALYPSEFI